MDASSTTQMAEIMVKHWRSSGTSWTKFVRTPTWWPLVWETVWGSSIGIWMVKRTRLGMSSCSPTTRVILVGKRGWHQSCLKKAEYGIHVGENGETCRFWRTNIISRPCILGMHTSWLQSQREYYWSFCYCIRKFTRMDETARKNCRVIIRYGRTREKVCWNRLWAGKQKDKATFQSLNFCLDDHHIRKARVGISLRIDGRMLTDCLEMFFMWHE